MGFKKFLLNFLSRSGVVHAAAKLDTRGHRSATNFALRPFYVCKFQSTEKARQLWPCRSVLPPKLTWQRHYQGGWGLKTLPTVSVCPSVHLGASLKVLPHPHGGGSTILTSSSFFSFNKFSTTWWGFFWWAAMSSRGFSRNGTQVSYDPCICGQVLYH